MTPANANRQLPLFAFSKQAQNNHTTYYWLKDVVNAEYFCAALDTGIAYLSNTSDAHGYVRPRFIIA